MLSGTEVSVALEALDDLEQDDGGVVQVTADDNRLLADFSINLVRRLDIRDGSRISVTVPGERIRVYLRQ